MLRWCEPIQKGDKSIMVKSARLCLCGLLAVLLLGSYVMADELSYIKQAIKSKGAKWEADETSVFKLSPEARRNKLGLNKADLPDASVLSPPAPLVGLPVTLDWRNNNGNWVTKVRDQGNCGSCWAFSTAAALESAIIRQKNTSGYDLDVAEQILVSCSGAGSCSGGSPGVASNYIRDTGLPDESVYPYTETNGTCPTWQAPTNRISSWTYVTTSSPTVDTLKNALVTYGPLSTTMEVYSDFFAYKSGIYSFTTGTRQGGHAILLIGYDDASQCFLCKNSWDTTWGESGYFKIAYSEINSVTQFGDYTIAYMTGSTPPPPPPPPSCSVTLSPTSTTFTSAGGTRTVSVTTGTGCSWSASESVGWITITSARSGTGNGTVAYSVAANTGKNARTGFVTVGGQVHTVKQNGAKRK
jgi:C1A family cysteine protease